jgi:TolB-like protein/DNA-binding winged helix-turn-helix (wHTH) protein
MPPVNSGIRQPKAVRPSIRAADLEIDPGLKRVMRDGRDLLLPPLSFDLLVALAEAAPNYLSHEELMARVWPGLVVAEKTITQRVKLLRTALGDDSRQPRYVAGLRGRGYRLVPGVSHVEHDRVPAGAEMAIGGRQPGPLEVATNALQPESVGFSMRARTRVVRRVGFAIVALVAVAVVALQVWYRGAPAPDARNPAALETTAVAVLPFRSLSGKEEAGLALGIPESVLDQLTRIPGLTVIARHSAFKAAAEAMDERELGQRLGARFLIDGSVQRSGDRLRVTASLTDAESARQLWTERYDSDIAAIFAIQDEIAGAAANALRAHVAKLGALPPPPPGTHNTEAYLSFLEGRALLARWSIVDTEGAERAFRRAIELDPQFAAAHALLYDARLTLAERREGGAANGPFRPRSWDAVGDLTAERADNAALLERALALDPGCGPAHFARAMWADVSDGDREIAFRTALSLDPGNARGITAFAEFLDRIGKVEEARQLLERAIELDPLSPRPRFWLVMRNWQNDATSLEDNLRGILELDPDFQPALQRYAKHRWFRHGEIAEAIQLIERALAADLGNPWLRQTATAIYLDAGDVAAARALVYGGPLPEVSGELLLRLYEGDRDGAARLAFSRAAFAHGPFENWGVYEAVRDATVASRDYPRGIEYLRQHAELDLDDPEVTAINFRSVPALAELLAVSGQDGRAERLIERSIRWIDEVHLVRIGPAWALRAKANLQLLAGAPDAALETLRMAFEAPDYQQWWYTLERDPLWTPLHEDPRFAAIVSHVHAHVAEEARTLAELRVAGLVPARGTMDAAQVD